MNIRAEPSAEEVRRQLEELGGRTAQDLGLGRIVGQVLVHLYFQPAARSLDQMEEDLGLSKAAVSVAARQLDDWGLVRRVWVSGDKRSYYRTAENLATALRQGVVSMLRHRLEHVEAELRQVRDGLEERRRVDPGSPDLRFVAGRVQRAQELQGFLLKALNSPWMGLLVRRKAGRS